VKQRADLAPAGMVETASSASAAPENVAIDLM
jgi:hypothetical protein